MALVTIQAPRLSKDQKKRIGDSVIEALHREGVAPSSIVVFFKREDADIVLDGGLLVEAELDPPGLPVPATSSEEYRGAVPVSFLPAPAQDYRNRARRNRSELEDLKAKLGRALQTQGALSSFQAQEVLDLKDCAWAPATLRRFFAEMEADGLISKQGQKRGTRYVWNGITSQVNPVTPVAKLVKKTEPTAESGGEAPEPDPGF